MADAKTQSGANAYEKFVQEIYQTLLNQTAVKTIKVEHDVKLKGKAGVAHQIDVYWEFELAGVRYRTCIECRHYSSRVEKSEVFAFAGIIDDLGDVNGIMVTTIGYQSGAEAVASVNPRIRLLKLNPVLQTIRLQFEFPRPHLSAKLRFEDAAEALIASHGGHEKVFGPGVPSNDTRLLNADGTRGPTVVEALLPAAQQDGKMNVPLAGYSMQSSLGPLPLVEAQCDCKHVATYPEFIDINVSGTVRAILEDVLAHTSEYVHEDGTREAANSKAVPIIPGGNDS